MRQFFLILNKTIVSFLVFASLFSKTYTSVGQELDFEFGRITPFDLKSAVYEKDTSAVAYVLIETGSAYFDTEITYDLIVNYHVRIKILKQEGVDKANVVIPLRKSEKDGEKIITLQASSFNLNGNVVEETRMNTRAIFDEDAGKFYNLKKFTIPNVKVGTIIEYKFTLQTPFIFNFYTWNFQSDIPKKKSEYWAKIPGNYVYNVSLRGALPLSLNTNEIISKCLVVRGGEGTYGAGTHADCVRYKFAMENIPAFIEEDYMTAKSNFLSAIHFELSEVYYFSGKVNKITKEWKDVEQELRTHKEFGIQLKRGKDLLGDELEKIISAERDSFKIANKIYDFIKESYQWNEVYGIYSEFGVKEAFATKRGNVGDINLTLIAAMKYAGFPVEPMILSTRKNGLPTELHPVISDFNYVIAKIKIAGKTYLLDATDDFMPFGMIPERCFNGKGRVLGEKSSYWYEIKPSEKARVVTMCNLKMDSTGTINGPMQRTYFGYRAATKRKEVQGFRDKQAYENAISNEYGSFKPSAITIENLDDLSKPVKESFVIELNDFASSTASNFLFNPFLSDRIDKNSFKSEKRLYPVDFGIPIEELFVLNIELADNISLSSLPDKVALALPANGGRYVFDIKVEGNRLTLTSMLTINRTVYSAEEYHYIRELYTRMIQAQNIDLIFTKSR
jgi:Domain of Unknown Function with PDB structure (DUF3857)